MKKLLLLLLFIPVLWQCKKDTDEPDNKICYLTKKVTNNFTSKYERNADGKITRYSFFADNQLNDYADYFYVGNDLTKIVKAGGYYVTYKKDGNTLSISNYVPEHISFENIFTLNTEGKIIKVLTYDYDYNTDTLVESGYTLYEYPNESGAVLKIYDPKTDKLLYTDTYTFDDKKNPDIYNDEVPVISAHNTIQYKRISSFSGEKEIIKNHTYTYNENNYPSSVIFNGTPTSYEYDCK